MLKCSNSVISLKIHYIKTINKIIIFLDSQFSSILLTAQGDLIT